MITTPPFDLVVFDCDGVLVDSEPIVNRVFVDLVGGHGLALDHDAWLHEFSGGSTAKRIAALVERHGWTPPSDFLATFDARLASALARDLRPIPGITDALSRVASPRCVASNGRIEDIRTRLTLTGLLSAFSPHLFSAAEVPRGKPHPDLFLHAARRMGTTPERGVVVEDSVPGVLAGVAAGMTVLGFARLTPPGVLVEAGARVFTDMRELPELLGATAR